MSALAPYVSSESIIPLKRRVRPARFTFDGTILFVLHKSRKGCTIPLYPGDCPPSFSFTFKSIDTEKKHFLALNGCSNSFNKINVDRVTSPQQSKINSTKNSDRTDSVKASRPSFTHSRGEIGSDSLTLF